MAWNPTGVDPDSGLELYSGDAPWDAFGSALSRIAAGVEREHGRLPKVAEVVAGLHAALRGAPATSVLDPQNIDERMRSWTEATEVKAPKRPRAKTGDVLRIPYAGGGALAVYGHVLFAPKRGQREGPGLGICVAVFDRDVGSGDDPAEVVTAPLLLGPLHPNDECILTGEWAIVGNVAVAADALPTFAMTVRREDDWADVISDYFGDEIEDNDANRRRVREQSVGANVAGAVRAIRGMGRWFVGYDADLPNERRP